MAESQSIHAEVWKPVVGYEGLYSVSDQGRIRRETTSSNGYSAGRLMKPIMVSTGYLMVALRRDGRFDKRWLLHRLVAFAFLGHPRDDQEVNHKNGIKHDNHAENLEWVTHVENIRHSIYVLRYKRNCGRGEHVRLSKLKDHQIPEIRALAAAGWTRRKIAEKFGVRHQQITRIVSGGGWRHVP